MSEELVILTRGQEALYKFLLFSDANIQQKLTILDRMMEIFTSQDNIKFLRMVREAAEETQEIVSYEFLVQKDFPYHLEHLEGETLLSPAEAHVTLGSEQELQRRKSASADLMGVSRHLLECRDPLECAKGNCPVLPKRNPLEVLDSVSHRLQGVAKEDKPLDFTTIYESRKKTSLGAQTFIKPFDEKIQGLEPGNLLVVAGFVGSYKTTFALNLAHQNAVKLGYNVVFITSEVPKETLYLWLLTRHSYEEKFSDHGPVHRLAIQKAMLEEEEVEFVNTVVEPDLKENKDYGKILILDETDFKSFTKAGIRAKLLSLDFDVDILVYDYVQLVKYMDEARELVRLMNINPVNYYVRMFADLAMHLYGDRHRVLSVLLSQINREGWKEAVENDGHYTLTALAEANELEKSAYYCVTLFSDQDLKESGELKAQLLKHRGGEVQESAVLTPLDSRYLAIGHGIEGFGDVQSTDLSGFLMGGSDMNALFGGFK